MTPIFLHSSYRTSSTWVWSKFRAAPSTMAFYEPLNPILKFDRDRILTRSVKDWNSGHKLIEPYFVEYDPLIGTRKGVPGLKTSFRFEKYIPLDGLSGTLDPDIGNYLRQFIELAVSRNKVAVFGEKVTLGRIVALKKVFQGFHVFIYRNLWDQWMSYVAQYENGQSFFIESIDHILAKNQHVPLFKRLKKGDFGEDLSNLNKACCTFLALHLFLYMHALESVDLAINVSRLASDDNYKSQIASRIESLSDLQINLDSARRDVGWFCNNIRPEEISKVKAVVLSYTKDWAGTKAVKFANALLDEFVSDSKYAEVFSKSIFTKYQVLKEENRQLRERDASLENNRTWKITRPVKSLRKAIRAFMS